MLYFVILILISGAIYIVAIIAVGPIIRYIISPIVDDEPDDSADSISNSNNGAIEIKYVSHNNKNEKYKVSEE